MSDASQDQAANIVPPRTGQIIALTVSNTSRARDLTTLPFMSVGATTPSAFLYLTLQCDVRWWFRFGSVTGTMDETAKDADNGNVPTFPANAGIEVAPDQQVHVRIERAVDLFLIYKAAGAGTLRMWPSSPGAFGASPT